MIYQIGFLFFMTALATAYPCQLDPIYMKQVERSLSPFQETGITPLMIETAKKLPYTCTVSIKNGKSNPDCTNHCIGSVYDEMNLPDMEIIMNKLDEPRVLKHRCNKSSVHWTDPCYCDEGFTKPEHGFFLHPGSWEVIDQLIPVFSPGVVPACFSDILVPNTYNYFQQFTNPPQIPWEQKQFKAIFRGTTTGGRLNGDAHFSRFHRHRLIDLCRDIPECDAKFHSYYQESAECVRQMKEHYGPMNYLSMRKQAQYKLNIDIDGFSYSQRFTSLMHLGVAIMKIYAFEEIGSVAAKPWQHYIPVSMGLQDFKTQLEWAKNNDEEVKAIAERGAQLANKLLKPQVYKCYTHILLLQYYKLLQLGSKDLHI